MFVAIFFCAIIIYMKSIDVGISSFCKLIEDNNIYVDKTDIIYNLMTSGSTYFFCSRPRRFGKTLTVSTLEAIFKGKKDLFKGLKIYEKDYDWKEYPVIHIDFGQINATDAEMLKKSLKKAVKNLSIEYAVEFDKDAEYYDAWSDLIKKVAKNSKVVILIDEYDKLLSSNIYNPEVEKMRDVLRGFFEVIKAQSANLQFVFITGVTKFAKVSIFSSMNNLNDISMDKEYATLFGYTEDELEYYFAEYIEKGLKATGLSYDKYMLKLAEKYDGYRFSPKSNTAVYNPVSIGLFFSEGADSFDNYWIDTGNMKLLMDVAKKVRFDIAKDVASRISRDSITVFDILEIAKSNVSLTSYRSLLFQSGYLTISGVVDRQGKILTLDFPNEEVSEAYSKSILELYVGRDAKEGFTTSDIQLYFEEGNTGDAIETVKAIYESIPYDLSKNADELYYSSIFFSSMKALGAQIGSEIETKNGRVDAILNTERHIYVFEFKRDESANIALKQIHDKGYANQFDVDRKTKIVHLVGINFSSKEKNITEYKEEIL